MITSIMAADYACCWIIEKGLKYLFSDYRPKDIALRRPDQLEREEKRRKEEELEAQAKRNEEIEKQFAEKSERIPVNPMPVVGGSQYSQTLVDGVCYLLGVLMSIVRIACKSHK